MTVDEEFEEVQAGSKGMTLSEAARAYASKIERPALERMYILAAETVERLRKENAELRAKIAEGPPTP